jgi:hypothetical protein
MQKPCSHNYFHCVLALFFSFVVLLQRTLMVINTVPRGQLFRIRVLFFYILILCFLFVRYFINITS